MNDEISSILAELDGYAHSPDVIVAGGVFKHHWPAIRDHIAKVEDRVKELEAELQSQKNITDQQAWMICSYEEKYKRTRDEIIPALEAEVAALKADLERRQRAEEIRRNRGWQVNFNKSEGLYYVYDPDDGGLTKMAKKGWIELFNWSEAHGFPDPDTATIAADEWLQSQEGGGA